MGANQSAPVCPPPPACPAPVTCPPAPTTLGFKYTSTNKSSDILLQKTQNVLTQFQNVGCQEIIPKIIYEIKNTKTPGSSEPADKTKQQFAAFVDKATQNTQGVSQASVKLLKNSIIDLFNTAIDNATVNGMVEAPKVYQSIIDMLSSFCPGEMMGKYTYVPRKLELTQWMLERLNNQGENYSSGQRFSSLQDLQNDIVNGIIPALPKQDHDGLRTLINTVVTNDTYNTLASKNFKATIIFKLVNGNVVVSVEDIKSKYSDSQIVEVNKLGQKYASGRKISSVKDLQDDFESRLTPIPMNKKEARFFIKTYITQDIFNQLKSKNFKEPIVVKNVNGILVVSVGNTTTKSTFGSMSNFGSMGGSWIMILLLLIIVAVLYFYSQGKLKFPTMGQRVAQFGRDIKSIRGIRARR
jgi:hypothetical protein